MLVLPGDTISLTYPRCTHVAKFRKFGYSRRTILVQSVRDLVRQPLTVAEFCRRPYLLRSRWLLTAIDSTNGKTKHFYLGSSLEFAAPSTLRVGLYDPDGDWPTHIICRGITENLTDRRFLKRALKAWQTRNFGDKVLRVFADDLRLIA